jgi:hypothetical protein
MLERSWLKVLVGGSTAGNIEAFIVQRAMKKNLI